jgi:hypothetical protein
VEKDRERRAAELRALFEQGILYDDTYRAALAGLGPESSATDYEATDYEASATRWNIVTA